MIIIKTSKEISKIKDSCSIVSKVLNELIKEVKPGIKTNYLNDLAEKLILDSGGIPAFKGYKGYPYTICASVNNEVLHGFPNNKPLIEGSILSIDLGVNKDGFYGDSAVTVPVGKINNEKIIKVCKECLYKGINQSKLGNRLSDISAAIQNHALSNGFNVIRDFSGHGIGRCLHEKPNVLNYTTGRNNILLKSGMIIAIEPAVMEGSYKVKRLDNEWTVVTEDGGLSAHFEHTVLIKGNTPEILT